MERQTELELIDRALANIEQGVSDMDGEPTTTPTSWYSAPGRLERERDTVFRRGPLFAGFASELARPGDFLTFDLGPLPVLMTRDASGELHAFANACRHRGSRLVDEPCGQGKKRITCPYHAWTYDLDGQLLAITHPEGFPGVDRSKLGLIELPIAERYGMIFVKPTPGASLDLDDELGPFVRDLGTWGLDRHVLFEPSRRLVEAQMSWKLFFDTSLESYHFEFLHQKTIAPYFRHNTGVFDWHAPHGRMVLLKRSITSLREIPRASWTIRAHGNLIYSVFPNLLVLVQPDHAMVASIYPTSPRTSRVMAGMLIPEAATTEEQITYWKKNETIFWNAIMEDLGAGERIQRTIDAEAIPSLCFGTYEHLITKFHRALDAALDD